MSNVFYMGLATIGMMAGNVVLQAITERNWKIAYERSFYHFTSFVVLALVVAIRAGFK